MKKAMLLVLSLVSLGAKAQKYQMHKVEISCLTERVTIDKEYTIERDKDFISFSKPFGGGSESWGFWIKDSTDKKTYGLQFHWMTRFDSMQISEDRIRLFNRSGDEIIYKKK